MKTFPHLEVKGDAAARGGAHGEAFRERIEKTFSFYMDDLFASSPLSGAEIEARANRIKALTVEAAPDCAAEISGIAAGANLEEWKLFVLNARTEILNAKVTECTAFYFAESRVLAQNWDWVEPLEDLAVVITHERDDGRRYAVFVEPGMIGKIGLNSDGIGVCLNILFTPHDLSGLPIHILNGALLDSDRGPQYTSDDFRALLARYGIECSMSGRGSCYDNAPVESFFALLKRERIRRRTYASREDAKADVFDYIERFYNRCRRHGYLDYSSPVDFERQAVKT